MGWQDAFEHAQSSKCANVVCMKWGTLYGPEWVNKLYGMVKRHTTWNIRFVCLTDDPSGIRPEVECKPFPPVELDEKVGRRWRKLCLYSRSIHDLTGMTLYLDMDILIVSGIDDLFTYPGRFCMMQVWRPNRYSEKVGNSSVVRLFVGEEESILARFYSAPHENWNKLYGGLEQRFVSDTAKEVTFYPPEWCASFKDTLPRNGLVKLFSKPRFPDRAKIVVFSGLNTPPAAIRGEIDPSKSPDPKRRKMRFRRRFRRSEWVERLWAE